MEIAEREINVFSQSNISGVINCYQDVVYRIAFTYCKNTFDADDITQEVFLRYLKSKKDFDYEEHLKAWLIRVTINVSKNHLRSAWFRKTVSISEYENLCADDQTQSEMYNVVLSLPEKYRSVVLLYYYEEYTVGETAKILSRTETAVQTQLQRARTILKTKLKEEWQSE
jgi:RNA polymerase sigma-70 factor (ECF subfamily)